MTPERRKAKSKAYLVMGCVATVTFLSSLLTYRITSQDQYLVLTQLAMAALVFCFAVSAAYYPHHIGPTTDDAPKEA
jgi:hypothetical protein